VDAQSGRLAKEFQSSTYDMRCHGIRQTIDPSDTAISKAWGERRCRPLIDADGLKRPVLVAGPCTDGDLGLSGDPMVRADRGKSTSAMRRQGRSCATATPEETCP